MINAARLCVPVHWRATVPPSIKEWVTRIDHLAAIEELIHTAQDRIPDFTSVWSEWFDFRDTADYQALV